MRRIIELVRPKLDWSTERNYLKSVNIQVLTAIRVFRSGSFQKINVDIYSLSQPTVSRIISKVAEAFAGEFKNFIEFPSNDKLDLIKYGFYKIAKFHNVVGLIDCTHVPVTVHGPDRELFRNRKGRMSINVQAIVDFNMKFTNMVVRWPGLVHDSRIFKNSLICAKFENYEINGWLLGDNGYSCTRYLLTPVLSPTTEAEERYNKAHIKTRNLIERAFGCWKRKFNILNVRMQTKLSNSLNIIMACAVIWNIIKDEEDAGEDDSDLENFITDALDQNNLQDQLDDIQSTGSTLRSEIIQRHFSYD